MYPDLLGNPHSETQKKMCWCVYVYVHVHVHVYEYMNSKLVNIINLIKHTLCFLITAIVQDQNSKTKQLNYAWTDG